MKTQDALSLLVALEERVARIYFLFFRAFREDPVIARCWWDMAQEEYGHAGILKMVRELVPTDMDFGDVGARLWALVETVEWCEQQARDVGTLARALELAIRLETSELDTLGRRVIQSLGTDLPEGASQSFTPAEAHYRHLVDAAGKVSDRRIRERLNAMLGGARES